MSHNDTTQGLTFDFTYHPSASPFAASREDYVKHNPDVDFEYVATGALLFDVGTTAAPKILLIQRAANDSLPNRWEIPGGGCDDEDPSILYAVARELWEEAGLKVSHIQGPVGEPCLFLTRSLKRVCKFNFMVEAETNKEGTFQVKLDPNEHQSFVWVNEAEVIDRKTVDGMDLIFTTEELFATVLEAFRQVRIR